jgi:outer membrane receptor protein involved in Fe transport
MTYARVASGYRIGGPNFYASTPGVPKDYKPDTTTNFELGLKGDFLEHRLSVDTSIYHINWHDFQIGVFNTIDGQAVFYETNAGDAKSDGVELSLQARPARGLTIAAQGSFNNAVLTEDLPPGPAYGLAGDRLPYSIRWSGGASVNQDFQLWNEWTGFAGGELTYVGLREGEFASGPPSPTTTPRLQYPAYTTINLRTGVRSQSWFLNLYVNNLADKRGIAGAQPTTSVGVTGGYYGTVILPRTIGLTVVRNF